MCLRIVALEVVAIAKFSCFKSLWDPKVKVHLQDNGITTADWLGKLTTSSINHWAVQLICERLWGSRGGRIVFELCFIRVQLL